jgi:catechol 2,3-dioxygenase-like lactoylglutathione lyase family enzyme
VPVEVIGIDHVYLAVRDLARSTRFYDGVMGVLGYKKVEGPIGGDPHVHYYNRQFGFSLRPARAAGAHDPYAPGLHHFCFRVVDERAVDRAQRELVALGVAVTEARLYPEYARTITPCSSTIPTASGSRSRPSAPAAGSGCIRGTKRSRLFDAERAGSAAIDGEATARATAPRRERSHCAAARRDRRLARRRRG